MLIKCHRIFLTGLTGLGVGALLLTACSSSPSERFRTRAPTDSTIKYKNPIRLKVTGIGCALNAKTALRISRKTATYNLRTILGNTRYLTSFKEVDRYEEDGQVCVETEIESHAP